MTESLRLGSFEDPGIGLAAAEFRCLSPVFRSQDFYHGLLGLLKCVDGHFSENAKTIGYHKQTQAAGANLAPLAALRSRLPQGSIAGWCEMRPKSQVIDGGRPNL